jgi:prepilin-type N-terminal cleavage/methylation domain-containing protein
MKKQAGFTLIELLLVLAIIGIISAIAIPALLGQRERAKAKAVQENASGIAGECARVNDQGKEQGIALTASDVVTTVLAMSQYRLPVAKNPYANGSVAYNSGASTTTGNVDLVAGSTSDPVTGGYVSSVTIVGHYLVGGVATTSTKVVSLD